MDLKLRFHQILSICRFGDVIHVVISRETERFVNEFDFHEAKTRSSSELLEDSQQSKESMLYKQREVTTSFQEIWVSSIRKLVQVLSNLFQIRLSSTQGRQFPGTRSSVLLFMLLPSVDVIKEIFISKNVTTMLRHCDQDERESDGSKHWEVVKSVFLRKFDRDGVRDFNDEMWLPQIFAGSSKKRIEYCKTKIFFKMRAIQGHSGGIPIEQASMGYVQVLPNWKKYIYHKWFSWNFQSMLGQGLIPGGKEKYKAGQAVFLTPTNLFGYDPEEEVERCDPLFGFSKTSDEWLSRLHLIFCYRWIVYS